MTMLQQPALMSHWLGTLLAQIGSYFTLIALPWLVLSSQHNSAFSLALVMACYGIPHSLLLLLGGALTDRYGPGRLILYSRAAFVLLMLLFASALWLGLASLPLICLFAFSVGCCSALGIPASQSILPALVPTGQLLSANASMMATGFVAQAAGPVLIGALIGWFASQFSAPSDSHPWQYLTLAFTADAALVALSLCCAWHTSNYLPQHQTPASRAGLWRQLQQSLAYCWQHPNLRVILSYLLLLSLLLYGPLLTLIPLLAKIQLALDAQGMALLYGCQGVGTLTGALLVLHLKPTMPKLGLYILLLDLAAAISFCLLGYSQSAMLSGALLLLIGITAGFVMVAGTTWFQLHIPFHQIGTVLGLVMFAIHGLVPLASLYTGGLASIWPLSTLTQICGSLVMLICITGLLTPTIRQMGKVHVTS